MSDELITRHVLKLKSNPSEVGILLDRMEKTLKMSGLEEISAFHLQCAVVEVMNNSIQHAYQNKPDHPIEISFDINPGRVRIGVSDRGPAFFGPPKQTPPSPQDESGRGYEIIGAWVNKLEFERNDDWNTCWLEQTIQSL